MAKKENIAEEVNKAIEESKEKGLDVSKLSEKDLVESAALFAEIYEIFRKHKTDIRMAYSVCAAMSDTIYYYMVEDMKTNGDNSDTKINDITI